MIRFQSIYGEVFNLSSKFIVCPYCLGAGGYCNPEIDGNGLPAHLLMDSYFMEGYKAGHYDVVCIECKGDRVIEVVDEESIDPETYARYTEELREAQECQVRMLSEYESERARGA